jgi:acyl carrier protein
MHGLEDLKRAFINGLGIPESTVLEGLQYRQIKQWDSVAHLQLVMEIENTFGIMLPTEDVIDLSSFEKAQDILKKHGVDTVA